MSALSNLKRTLLQRHVLIHLHVAEGISEVTRVPQEQGNRKPFHSVGERDAEIDVLPILTIVTANTPTYKASSCTLSLEPHNSPQRHGEGIVFPVLTLTGGWESKALRFHRQQGRTGIASDLVQNLPFPSVFFSWTSSIFGPCDTYSGTMSESGIPSVFSLR